MRRSVGLTLGLALCISFSAAFVNYWIYYYSWHVLGIPPKDSDTRIWLSTDGIFGGLLTSALMTLLTFWAYFIPALIVAIMLRTAAWLLRHPAAFLVSSLIIASLGPFLLKAFLRIDYFSTVNEILRYMAVWAITVGIIANLFFWFFWRKVCVLTKEEL